MSGRSNFRKTRRHKTRGTPGSMKKTRAKSETGSSNQTERVKQMTSAFQQRQQTNIPRHDTTGAAVTSTPETVTPRAGPTPAEINRQQQADAEQVTRAAREQQAAARNRALATSPNAPATPPVSSENDRGSYEQNLRHDTTGTGPIVTYNGKDGGYFLDKQEFNINRLFLARPDLISWGWIRFDPDTGFPTYRMRSIKEGLPANRLELSDPPNADGTPNASWPRNDFGEITDPWQYQEILPVAALDASGEVYQLVGRNWATRKAMKSFRQSCSDNLYHRHGLAPVIRLIDTVEFNKKRKVEVPKPIIHIESWRNPDGSETPEALSPTGGRPKRDPKLITSGKSLLADEMDDELPDHL
jgi:hypothetical protein